MKPLTNTGRPWTPSPALSGGSIRRFMVGAIELAAALVALLAWQPSDAMAQHGAKNVRLHINTRWSECSFQLDPSLTQQAFRQFAQEGGLVTYFRPLVDAAPMGAGEYEFAILQWKTGIDDEQAAWNDTFVHPDSVHWLFEGDGLAFPGLTFRAGITDRIDVGVYFTKAPGANYGFWGGQAQVNLMQDRANDVAASARVSFVAMYGPEDVGLNVAGVDLVASKRFRVWEGGLDVSPYAGVSTFLSTAYEMSGVVDLDAERVLGAQASVGAVAEYSVLRLAAEYNVARVNSLSFKVGVAF